MAETNIATSTRKIPKLSEHCFDIWKEKVSSHISSLESYSKSKSALDTLLAMQRKVHNKTGLGLSDHVSQASIASTSSSSSTKMCLEKCHPVTVPKSTRVTTGRVVYKVVPYSYHSTAVQAKLPEDHARSINALYGPDGTFIPDSESKASGSLVHTPASLTNPGTKTSTPKPPVPVAKPVAPSNSATRPPRPKHKSKHSAFNRETPPVHKPSVPLNSTNSEGEPVGLIKCDLCCGNGHLVHDCLLRYTPGSKGKHSSKMAQVWTPKRN